MSGENCLAGLKILDLTQFEAGPSCTEALAWMGADVVKIENPKIGDPGRVSGGKASHDAFYFLQYNANKRSVAVNLKDPHGLALVKDLAKTADVMIENFAPGAIERLGLGYDVIRAINPAIIFCQVKGFGTGSPFENNLAFDMIAQACGGLMSVTGEEDGPPCKPGATIGDTGTGMLMAVSILGAYIRRLRTGLGEHLQVAMQDAILHYIRNAKTVGGGNPPIGVYPCKGGGPNDYVYIYTSAANPEHWVRLLKVMGRDDLINDQRFANPAARTQHREEVDQIVSEWTIRHDKHTAMQLVGRATIPAGAVLDTRELADDPTFLERGIRQTMKHPEAGDYVMSGWPVRFGGRPPAIGSAPLLGQHGAQVLADWLSYDASRIAELKNNEVIA
jgi:crotonobetainyl-CoA:carnitine CoA-transferase CaiB-like acyl-CoA transferase